MSAEMILFLLVFAGVTVIVMLVWGLVAWSSQRAAGRLQQHLAGEGAQSIIIDDRLSAGKANRFDLWFERMIFRTGLDVDARTALAAILLCGMALAAGVFIWRYELEPWLAVPAFVLGAAVPSLFFLWRQGTWRRSIQLGLPDAFFMLARSVRAGRSVDQAFQFLGEQGPPPLRREFARMHRQLELGLSLSHVLQSAADRLGLIDFNIFASVMSLHRASGGNLPALLDRLAAATRDRNQFEGQYRAATVLGRYSAAFILCMVGIILIYLFFFQREEWAMRFFTVNVGTAENPVFDFTGPILFATAIGLELFGGLLLYLLMRHEY